VADNGRFWRHFSLSSSAFHGSAGDLRFRNHRPKTFPMSPQFYYILHLSSLVVLLGYTFYGFAAAAETRKRVLMMTGIMSVLMLVSGIGLLHKLALGFPTWAIVKLVCWLGLSALAGLAYRRRAQANGLMLLGFALAIVAVAMVYLKPF
jgi:hypothetical protein